MPHSPHTKQGVLRPFSFTLIGALLMACTSLQEPLGPHPDGPPQLADFDFAIGEWTYVTTTLQTPDGRPRWDEPALPAGAWSFRYALDGWVVQDEFTQPLGDGTTLKATSIRAFDEQAGIWRVRGVVTGIPGWDEFDVTRVGETVVMTGSSARVAAASKGKALERITFYDFEKNEWKRRGELSLDGGKTWSETAVFSHATRVAR